MTVSHVLAAMFGFTAGYWFCLLLDRRIRRWLNG